MIHTRSPCFSRYAEFVDEQTVNEVSWAGWEIELWRAAVVLRLCFFTERSEAIGGWVFLRCASDHQATM